MILHIANLAWQALQTTDRGQFDLLWHLGHFVMDGSGKYTDTADSTAKEDAWIKTRSNESFWSEAIARYQEFTGVDKIPGGSISGVFDLWTRQILSGRFCSCPDVLSMSTDSDRATGRTWEKNDITWGIVSGIDRFGLPRSEVEAAARDAFDRLAAVCTVNLTLSHERPDIWATVEPIDGGGSTLAVSVLGYQGIERAEQRYDSGERWQFGDKHPGIPLHTVILHEIIHALGGGHISSSTPAIMNPFVSDRRDLTPADVQLIRRFFEAREGRPDPPDDPNPKPRYRVRQRVVDTRTNVEIQDFTAHMEEFTPC